MSLNVLSILVRYLDVDDPNELYENFLYDLSINGLNVISINAHPRDIRGMHELSVNGLNSQFVHIFYLTCYTRRFYFSMKSP